MARLTLTARRRPFSATRIRCRTMSRGSVRGCCSPRRRTGIATGSCGTRRAPNPARRSHGRLPRERTQSAAHPRHDARRGGGRRARQRLNPEILTLIRRAYAGDSTHAEQEIVGDVLAFVEAYHAGTHTPEQAARLEALLAEFKLPLWGT